MNSNAAEESHKVYDTFIAGFKQKGGTGASDLHALLSAASALDGVSTVVIDADLGLRSLRNRYGSHAAIHLPDVSSITPHEFLVQLRKEYQYVFLDLPGGFPRETDETASWIWEFIDLAQKAFSRRYFFYVAASNAEGSTKNAKSLCETFKLSGENIIAKIDVSGSNNFDTGVDLSAFKLLNVMHIESGICAAIRLHQRSIADTLRFPDPNYSLVTKLYCKKVLSICQDPVLDGFFSPTVFKKLTYLAEGAPQSLQYSLNTVNCVHNRAIIANQKLSKQYNNVLKGPIMQAFLSVTKLRKAYLEYNEACTQ